MRFEVERFVNYPNERKVWHFIWDEVHGFRLHAYKEQTRKTKRSKWEGKSWDSMDERAYASSLQRPTSIPSEIMHDARKHVESLIYKHPVYIGWFNTNCQVKQRKFGGDYE
jgi:hypothetical protein